jgi:hypothetical protein
MNGNGTYKYSDGKMYHGSFKNDKKNGKGFQFFNEDHGRCAYHGEWFQGKQHGDGFQIIPKGENLVVRRVKC